MTGAVWSLRQGARTRARSSQKGTLEGDELIVRGHGWRFNCQTGNSSNRPGVSLKTLPIGIEDQHVLVDRAELLKWKQSEPKPGPCRRRGSPAPVVTRPSRTKGVALVGQYLATGREPVA